MMTGIDYPEHIVVRRVINKGTKIISEPLKTSSWVGPELKEKELERLSLAGDLMLLSGKGTGKFKLSDMAKTKPVLPKGFYISTGKGTGRMRIE